MSGVSRLRNIGAYIASTGAPGPDDAGAGAANGDGVDRTGFQSCTVHVACGAASGGPSAQTVDAKLQHSDDDTVWADIPADVADPTDADQLTADNTQTELDVNLDGVKKYVRVVRTVGFTGGTSPAIPVSTTLILGGAIDVPAAIPA